MIPEQDWKTVRDSSLFGHFLSLQIIYVISVLNHYFSFYHIYIYFQIIFMVIRLEQKKWYY